jgi:hypothetical protein
MAPLMLPLNQIRSSCLTDILISKYLQIPTIREGMNTPKALAKTHDSKTAMRKGELNLSCSMP